MNDWFDAEQRVERAQQFTEAHQWNEALRELDEAIAINGQNALWHAQRGYILEELDRDEEAAEAYERSFNLDPGDNDVALALGVTLARLGRFGTALEVLDGLTQREPNFEPAYCHRIHLYSELGRHDQAEEVFYLAQQLDDECPDCFFHLGGSLAARGEYDRAVYCWQRVLELEPAYVGVNRQIGEAYRAKGEFALAREHLIRELRDDPGCIDLLLSLADLALQTGDTPAAIAKLEQLLELDPTHADARMALGRIRLRSGQPQQALELLSQLDAEQPPDLDFGELGCLMGEAQMRLGRFAEAKARLLSAQEKDPQDLRTLILLGDANLALEKAAEAAEYYRRVIAVERNPFAQHRLAVCLLKLGRPSAALEQTLSALTTNPDFVEAMYHTALAHLRLANWREARRWIDRALKAAPENEAIRQLRESFWRYRLGHYFRWLRR
jgi:tetratricopeptide (TPR) repeat protein